jgi:hypothetical protein
MIHAFLHNHELLLLLLDLSSEISILGIQLGQQVIDLHLFGLTLALGISSRLTRRESSNSVSCLLYLAMTLETSELLFLDESSARSLANDKSRLSRSSSSLWL